MKEENVKIEHENDVSQFAKAVVKNLLCETEMQTSCQ